MLRFSESAAAVVAAVAAAVAVVVAAVAVVAVVVAVVAVAAVVAAAVAVVTLNQGRGIGIVSEVRDFLRSTDPKTFFLLKTCSGVKTLDSGGECFYCAVRMQRRLSFVLENVDC